MNDVVRATVKEHNKTPGKMEWRVLIVDDQSMRMVSACTKMHELSTEGITSNRQALHFNNENKLSRHCIDKQKRWRQYTKSLYRPPCLAYAIVVLVELKAAFFSLSFLHA